MATRLVISLLLSIMLCNLAAAEKKGVCPPTPPVSASRCSKPKVEDSQQNLSVTVLTVISDTGYVCSAQVLDGVEKDVDHEAIKAVRSWHFDPAKKDDRPVPVVITVEIKVERNEDGKLVLAPAQSDTKHSANQ